MKKTLDIDLWTAIFFSALLVWGAPTVLSPVSDFINYVYLIYFIMRLVVFVVSRVRRHKKDTCCWNQIKWGTPLRTIALFVFFVVAIVNIVS